MIEGDGLYYYIISIPVVLLIGIPLIAFLFWYVATLALKQNIFAFRSPPGRLIEKRTDTRINIRGTHALITDGRGQVVGKVSNVSRSGICITGLPINRVSQSGKFVIEMIAGVQVLKLHITPKWQKINYQLKSIGVVIDDAPNEWYDFVSSVTPTSP